MKLHFRAVFGGDPEPVEGFYAYDANGNVTDVVNGDTGAIAAPYGNSPFGEPVVQAGDTQVLALNPYAFTTNYLDHKACLYYYGHRFNNSETGRWLSRDPIGEMAFVALDSEMANAIRRERLNDYDLLNRIALADQIGVADAYLFVGNSPISSYDYLGLSWFSCWGNCIDKWKWDWGAILGIALTPGTPIGKTELEKLWTSAGVSEQTTWLSRAVGKGNQLLMKLPLGSPVRTKLIGALKDIRWAARNPAVVGASTAASLLVVLEGFYDVGIEIRCGVECCIDSSAY